MRRHSSLNFTTLALIVILCVSFISLLPAKSSRVTDDSENEEIIPLLASLKDRVNDLGDDAFGKAVLAKGRRRALENKIRAVVHQLKDGKSGGVLNKLERDLKKTIRKWIAPYNNQEAEDLIELIDEIIRILKGESPPKPTSPDFEIDASPDSLTIQQGSSDTSTVVVESIRDFNQLVELSATVTPQVDVTVRLDPPEVVPTPEGTSSVLTVDVASYAQTGTYRIEVTGTNGTLERETSVRLKITAAPPQLGDTIPPRIVNVLRSPEQPNYNESVNLTAFVTDNDAIKFVNLTYGDGTSWTTISMELKEGLYEATVPAHPYGTTVEYHVSAFDLADLSDVWSDSYVVGDIYLPLVRIDQPAQGDYLHGTVAVRVFVEDQDGGGESGLEAAELSMNDTVVSSWTTSGEHTYSWDTAGQDGIYEVKLRARDYAGNLVQETITATVDNTSPTATINSPIAGSYLRGSVLIEVAGDDANFDRMELRIDGTLIKRWWAAASEIHEWNTSLYADGGHNVALAVFDKAGNSRTTSVEVIVDNAAPVVGVPNWSPEQPAANQDVAINVTVTDPSPSSGLQSVALWYMNSTLDEWRSVEMTLIDGNWTAKLANQSGTVRFYITAFDMAGNHDETSQYEFTAAVPEFQLALLLGLIASLAAGSAGGAYYWNRRRRRKTGSSALPISASPEPLPPTPLPKPKPRSPKNPPAAYLTITRIQGLY